MVCMAPSTTNSIVDGLIDGYDADVLKWTKDLAKVCVYQEYYVLNITM